MTLFDPAAPRLKPRLAAGEPTGVAWFTLGNATLIEIASRHRPDAIVIDMQHGLFDRMRLEDAAGRPTRDRVERRRILQRGRHVDPLAEAQLQCITQISRQFDLRHSEAFRKPINSSSIILLQRNVSDYIATHREEDFAGEQRNGRAFMPSGLARYSRFLGS